MKAAHFYVLLFYFGKFFENKFGNTKRLSVYSHYVIRRTMNKSTVKRKPRSYKIEDKTYAKAMRRAKKEKTNLANLVEEWVSDYSNGYYVKSIGVI